MKKKIGYTTGVYDLFHIGHLNIIKNAKAQCDFLIVGVTTDELCMEKKNKQPVIPYSERIEILNSIKYIDKVVPQMTMRKIDAWEEYKFNKMFVGDDWKGTNRWNKLEKEFSKLGVEIVYFPYTRTTSSSIIREILQLTLADNKT
jgi:glycerol-3-phosphate cytidylyltransferase